MSASTLPREDLSSPSRAPHRLRLLIVGETPARHKEAREQARMLGAAESISIDRLSERAAKEQLKITPPDRVLVLGALHTLDATGAPALTYAGRQAARFLRGAFPVRWCPGDSAAVDLSTMPEPM